MRHIEQVIYDNNEGYAAIRNYAIALNSSGKSVVKECTKPQVKKSSKSQKSGSRK